jgi:hypothetical protein
VEKYFSDIPDRATRMLSRAYRQAFRVPDTAARRPPAAPARMPSQVHLTEVSAAWELLIVGGHVIDPASGLDGPADIALAGSGRPSQVLIIVYNYIYSLTIASC